MKNEFDLASLKRKTILSGFEEQERDIEKSKSGVYSDNSVNSKLNRVGQQYGKSKDEKSNDKPVTKEPIQKTIDEHAKTTETETLKKVLESDKASEELKSSAKKELSSRGIDLEPKSGMKMSRAEHKSAIESLNKAISELDGVDTASSEKTIKDLIKQRSEHETELAKLKQNKK